MQMEWQAVGTLIRVYTECSPPYVQKTKDSNVIIVNLKDDLEIVGVMMVLLS